MALSPDETAIKMFNKELSKEILKKLQGPSFSYLKPDCCEQIIVKFIVMENNQLKLHKVIGKNERLINYTKSIIKKNEFIANNSAFQGKMLRIPITFKHVRK